MSKLDKLASLCQGMGFVRKSKLMPCIRSWEDTQIEMMGNLNEPKLQVGQS